MVALSGPTEALPLVAWEPLQPPEATQLVASVDDHVTVAVPFGATDVGLTFSVTVGAGVDCCMVTVTDCAVLPPAPVQVSVYITVAISGPTLSLPIVFLLPDQPPEAVQLVALLVVQLNVVLLFAVTVTGFALRLTVGGGVDCCTFTDTDFIVLPPALFVQVNVKVLLAASGPTVSLPFNAFVPLQPPDAVHAFALLLVHVSVELP